MPFPIEEKYILETEEKLHGRLPHHFREKMKAENGGEIQTKHGYWEIYPIYDSSDQIRIKRTCNNIVSETESAREWYGFPEEAIAIGVNGRSDRLVLFRQSRSKYGEEIFIWNHETLKLTSVAKNFKKLMNDDS